MAHANMKARSEAKAAKARELGVSISTVNRRKLVENDLESSETRAEKAKKAREHREKCMKYAQMVENRQIRAKEAAYECGLSMRSFYRWLAKVKGE